VGFHVLVERLTKADVPILFLDFPRLAEDADYLFGKLQGLLPKGMTAEAARAAHGRIADRRLVRIAGELKSSEDDYAGSILQDPSLPPHETLDAIAIRRELRSIQTEKTELETAMAELEQLRQRTQSGLTQAMDGLRQTTKELDKRRAELDLAREELRSAREALRISEEARHTAEQAIELLTAKATRASLT
jgi:DNA repair exonuclease SbcCD ATPase subunit